MKRRKDFIWEISYRHFKAFRMSTVVSVLTAVQLRTAVLLGCDTALLRDRIMTFRSNVVSVSSWLSVRKTTFLSMKTKSLHCLERSGSSYALTQCPTSGEPNPFPPFNRLKLNGKFTRCMMYIRNSCKVKKLCILSMHLQCIFVFYNN